MPYVTSIERLAGQEGYIEGLKEALAIVLDAGFGAAGTKLLAKTQTVKRPPDTPLPDPRRRQGGNARRVQEVAQASDFTSPRPDAPGRALPEAVP